MQNTERLSIQSRLKNGTLLPSEAKYLSGNTVESAYLRNVDPIQAWTMWFIQNPLEYAELKVGAKDYPEDTWSNSAISSILKDRVIPKCFLAGLTDLKGQKAAISYTLKNSDLVLALYRDRHSKYMQRVVGLAKRMRIPFLEARLKTNVQEVAEKFLALCTKKDTINVYFTGSLAYELGKKMPPKELALYCKELLEEINKHKSLLVRTCGESGVESAIGMAATKLRMQAIHVMDTFFTHQITEVRYEVGFFEPTLKILTLWPK